MENICPSCNGNLRRLELVDTRERSGKHAVPELECASCHKQYREISGHLEFVRDRPEPTKGS